ncbi:MAG: hypothetical protein LH472_07350 [Pyrinomonadaceae bacterium]|nr:hypothetical protein [Pyrinomonadaceae bacterium]
MKKIKDNRLERQHLAGSERGSANKSCGRFNVESNANFFRALRSLPARCWRSSPLRVLQISIFICAVIPAFACHYNSFEKPNVNVAPAENKQSAFESDLQTLKTANLKYILVFRRTDGGAFDGEDRKYLKTNLPTTNRVILTDESRAFIVGSNYKFPPENLEVLRLRFKVEDFSTAAETVK